MNVVKQYRSSISLDTVRYSQSLGWCYSVWCKPDALLKILDTEMAPCEFNIRVTVNGVTKRELSEARAIESQDHFVRVRSENQSQLPVSELLKLSPGASAQDIYYRPRILMGEDGKYSIAFDVHVEGKTGRLFFWVVDGKVKYS